jgi:uncharacterized protein YacL
VFDLAIVRAIFILVLAGTAYALHPFHSAPWLAAGGGVALGAAIVFFEIRLEKVSLKRLIGAATGSVLGIIGAFLISLVLGKASSEAFLQVAVLLLMTYIGLVVGAQKGDMLIIDGRIADIAETGFLDGVIVIPQFVLRELQLVADSSDSMKRNRGRRGLDILQRIQKMAHLTVEIVEEDFPQIREVDMKLIELAKIHDCKIITNDFNLNKVAQLHGVEVLNINELANALKPIVLPGETMRVFILKEGKEYNQGVAYLDDGTMVVVDNAKRMISKTIEIAVTSVLQTTAGKMIFGKYDERLHAVAAGAERHERPLRKSDPQPVTNLGPEKTTVES